MTVPTITHSSIRKLAAMLGEVDSSSLKHSERIELIASSMGLRGDALMHALKTADKALTPADVAARISSLGLPGIEPWIPWLVSRSKGSVFLVCGNMGDRAIATCQKLAEILVEGGRVLLDDLVGLDQPLPGNCRDAVVIENNHGFLRAVRYAEAGAIVFVKARTSSMRDAYDKMVELVDEGKTPSVDVVRGVSVQKILGGTDKQRVPIIDFRSLETSEQRQFVLKKRVEPWFAEFGTACIALDYVRSGRIAIDEVKRAFGKDVEIRIEKAIKAYPELAVKVR
ncbi:hypothetical protein [Rhizobium sp. BK176]|uniref:hypothetical protein n=1 Tax=Rhizobium sp. BK176 TaxID=2587071 RepID=UPI00216A7B39|nr:hypothetical protein [Rhizobium sp. BK176]MCS4088825.1 hypothetical protein [Rhizobium sp. BK176]